MFAFILEKKSRAPSTSKTGPPPLTSQAATQPLTSQPAPQPSTSQAASLSHGSKCSERTYCIYCLFIPLGHPNDNHVLLDITFMPINAIRLNVFFIALPLANE